MNMPLAHVEPSATPTRSGLRRILGVGFGLAVIVGSTLSIGILRAPGLPVGGLSRGGPRAIRFGAFPVVVVAALVLPPPMSSAAASSPGPAPPPSLVGVVVALRAVVITYGGWQSALYFTEEDCDPNRNLPRSMIAGVASVIVVYLLVNLALLSVLPVPDLARSTLPAADAAQILMGSHGRPIITVLSLVSLPPLLNAIMMIGTRILFAMGRDGLLWRRTAEVTAGGAPVVATVVTTAVAVVLIVTGTFQKLVAIASFFLVLNYSGFLLSPVRPLPREVGR